MKITAIVEAMVAAGATPDMILVAVRATEQQMENALEKRRQHDAERQARKREREKSRDVTLRHSDRYLTGVDARGDDKTSSQRIEPQKEEKKETRAARDVEFDSFWALYPNKVGKAAAKSSFVRARAKADFETLMSGLRRYVAKADDRAWCNPTTWLNQDRWTDEPAVPVARAGPSRAPPKVDPTLAAARRLQEQFDAVTPSEVEGSHPYPRLVAFSGGG